MGKLKKIKSGHGDSVAQPGFLEEQLLSSDVRKQKRLVGTDSRISKKKIKRAAKKDREEFVGTSLTKKILEEALKQQQELSQNDDEPGEDSDNRLPKNNQEERSWRLGSAAATLSDEDDDDDQGSQLSDDDRDQFFEPVEIDEEEEEALEKFMSRDAVKRRTLADVIQEKIAEKRSEVATEFSDVSLQLRQLDPRLVEMYKGVRDVLSTYRSGKLPKAFKIVPNLVNWEQILELTEPDKWSAAAMYQATRIFASNLNVKMCQRFYNLVLLPRIRDDIAEYKKLNFHLYQVESLPFTYNTDFVLFFISMTKSGTCTLREAAIISSVLTKCSVPVLHVGAAMLKIAEMDYSGASSMFLRTLIDKKYTLPFRVIDALVFHFLRFINDKRELPVLWHQALLALAQRYKGDISSEQRESLFDLIKVHNHYMISPEIRRELVGAVSRDVENGSTMKTEEFSGMEF